MPSSLLPAGLTQIPLLTKKNLLVQSSRKSGLFGRAIAPFLVLWAFMYFTHLIASLSAPSSGSESGPMHLPACRDFIGADNCTTVMYDHGDDARVQAIMTKAQVLSGLPPKDFQPLPLSLEVDGYDDFATWIDEHAQNYTSSVVRWLMVDSDAPWPEDAAVYAVLTNKTTTSEYFGPSSGQRAGQMDISLELSELLNRAIIEVQSPSGSSMAITPAIKLLPDPFDFVQDNISKAIDASLGWVIFAVPVLILFHGPLNDMSMERVKKLHQGLVLMGMKQSAYVLSWFTYWCIWAVITSLLTLASLGSSASLWNSRIDLDVLIKVISVTSVSTVAFSILAASLAAGLRSAIGLSALFYMVTGLLLLNPDPQTWEIAYGPPPSPISISYLLKMIHSFSPGWHLTRIVAGMAEVVQKEWDEQQSTEPEPHFTWHDMTAPFNATEAGVVVPPLSSSYNYMLYTTPCWLFAAWFTYQMWPGPNGAGANVFSLQFWGLKDHGRATTSFPQSWKYIPEHSDEDVTASIERVFDPPSIQDAGLIFAGLTKRYNRGTFTAVDQVSFSVPETGCISILGHNGAGKSTAINCVLGIEGITTGDVIVRGRSAVVDAAGVRSIIGICLQHDVLWDELTPRQTLHMFARLKGVASSFIETEVERVLTSVRLTTVADHPVSSFSGGMKRRLSVGVSTIGSPEAIFLDEPTAGLDPLNKRHIWDLVQELKKTKLVLLTTHSMLEADALADNIAVMASGTLKAFGASLRLKELYGLGFHLDVMTEPGNEDLIQELVDSHLGRSAKQEAANAGSLSFAIPSSGCKPLVEFLKVLEKMELESPPLVLDWGVSHTTLEEVFLNITSGRAAAKARQEARKARRVWKSSQLPKGNARSPDPQITPPDVAEQPNPAPTAEFSLSRPLTLSDSLEDMLAAQTQLESLIAAKKAASGLQ